MTRDQIAALVAAAGTDIALTLWPEWAWTIVYLDKDDENRGYDLLKSDRRLRDCKGRLWVHAGLHIGGGGPREAAIAGVVHMAQRAGWRFEGGAFIKGSVRVPFDVRTIPRGALVATARIDTVAHISTELLAPCPPWAVPGACAHRLADRAALVKPIPCKGLQGLWSVRSRLGVAA